MEIMNFNLSPRHVPSLPRRHVLLGGSRPTEAVAQVPRDQDVLGPTEESSGAEGRLGRGKHCRPGPGLGGHHQPPAEEASAQQDPVGGQLTTLGPSVCSAHMLTTEKDQEAI